MTSVIKFVMSLLSSFTPSYFRIGDTKYIHLDEQKTCIRDVTLKCKILRVDNRKTPK